MKSQHHRSARSTWRGYLTGLIVLGLCFGSSPSAATAGLAIETHLSNGIILASQSVDEISSETQSAFNATGLRIYRVDNDGMRGWFKRLWKKFHDSVSGGSSQPSPTPTPQPTPTTTPTPQPTPTTTPTPQPTPTPSTGQLPGTMTFTGMEGGPKPPSQTINVTNTGGGTLSWSASQPASWLTLTPNSGTTTTETDVITVSVNTGGMTANTYPTTITISAPGSTASTQLVPVTLTVTPPTSTIGLSPANLAFVGQQGGTQPPVQTFNITNKGKGTLSWTVSEASSWLSLTTPASGTTTTETDVIGLTVNTAGLTTNTYSAPITITASGASNSPQQIMVSLAITAPASGMAKLTWDPNTDTNLTGYKVYAGTSPRAYGSPITVGNVTTFDVINLTAGQTYYFAVTAYNGNGESSYSNEASKSIP